MKSSAAAMVLIALLPLTPSFAFSGQHKVVHVIAPGPMNGAPVTGVLASHTSEVLSAFRAKK